MFRIYAVISMLLLFASIIFPACNDTSAEIASEKGLKSINGTELYFNVMGSGEPIAILHGGPGMSHDYFLPQIRSLAESYQLIFFDQRLNGRSSGDVDSGAVTLENFVQDIEGLRKTFGLQRINLLGHSWGGFLAMKYAIKYPKNLKSLVLMNTVSASSELAQQANQEVVKKFTQEDIKERAKILQSDQFKNGDLNAMAALFRVTLRPSFFNVAMADSLRLFFPADYREKSTKLQLLYSDVASYEIHDDLAAITCPTLIIHSDSDPTPVTTIEKIRDAIPNSQLAVLNDCGHFPFIESPVAFFKAIDDFMKRL